MHNLQSSEKQFTTDYNKIKYNIIILLAALSVNKPSDALRTVYFDKALEIIQMEQYNFSNEDETDSNNNGKIKIELLFFAIFMQILIQLLIFYYKILLYYDLSVFTSTEKQLFIKF